MRCHSKQVPLGSYASHNLCEPTGDTVKQIGPLSSISNCSIWKRKHNYLVDCVDVLNALYFSTLQLLKVIVLGSSKPGYPHRTASSRVRHHLRDVWTHRLPLKD
ncbi:hypothetical protein PAHAL_4G111600 [Panicum hallii]|uniref:Uncharacterized protein n=1 Tax=Panicum hallii TaxID=206008 RepID=A0A2T8JCL6_9POAL|nr:hypothetical protein PAHAL_4G111600 [Panicum hallii]